MEIPYRNYVPRGHLVEQLTTNQERRKFMKSAKKKIAVAENMAKLY